MNQSLVNMLIEKLNVNNSPCVTHLRKAVADLTVDEMSQLNKIIGVFLKQGISIEEQCAGYQQFLDMSIEESKFFMENGRYRYSTFAEVADKVYFDKVYMKKYVIGIALSQYLWTIHKNCYEYFLEGLEKADCVDSYVEIGTGHGAYFNQAIRSGKFKNCTAIDLSETSLHMTRTFVETYNVHLGGANVRYINKDVNEISGDNLFDFLVMCEVLEHLEEPLKILKKLRRILKKDGRAYLSIPINAPEIDHIFLFSSPEEVEKLLQEAGFMILEQRCFCANGNKIQRALKFKEPIIMCVWIK